MLREVGEWAQTRALSLFQARGMRMQEQRDHRQGPLPATTNSESAVSGASGGRNLPEPAHPGRQVAADPVAHEGRSHLQPGAEAEQVGALLLAAVFHQERSHGHARTGFGQSPAARSSP